MFEWDGGNLRKIQTHKIKQEEAEQALANSPILVYSQTQGAYSPLSLRNAATTSAW